MSEDGAAGNGTEGGASAAYAFPRHAQTFPTLTPQAVIYHSCAREIDTYK
ncbi:hypothetical protein [Bradyrhizobium sp.]